METGMTETIEHQDIEALKEPIMLLQSDMILLDARLLLLERIVMIIALLLRPSEARQAIDEMIDREMAAGSEYEPQMGSPLQHEVAKFRVTLAEMKERLAALATTRRGSDAAEGG
jgi:hypothetical protein